MLRILAIIIIAMVIVNIPGELFAQGEAAVPFLLIAPGARNGGMGEAGVALVNDATAAYWNPAGLAFQFEDPEIDKRYEISLMHTKWLPQFNFSDLFYDYLAARFYWPEIGMLGGSITFLNLGKNVYTNDQGQELGTFESFEYAIALSYATKLQPNLGIGVNAKIIQSNLAPRKITVGSESGNGSATTLAIDLGLLWTPEYEFLNRRLNLGMNLSNFGPKVTYIDKAQADPLPTNLRLGLALTLFDDSFNKLTAIYDVNRLLVHRDSVKTDGVMEAAFYTSWTEEDFFPRFTSSVGLEYSYGQFIALRAGYFYEDPNNGGRKFLTFGGGLTVNVFKIDFSYLSTIEEDHPLSDTMRFSLGIKF